MVYPGKTNPDCSVNTRDEIITEIYNVGNKSLEILSK
jgi:hypothetical protein